MRMNRSFARMRPLLLMALVLTFVLAAQVTPTYAAAIVVNTNNDELNADGDCSLREAIETANTNLPVDACVQGTLGTDTITFVAPGIGTHTLTLGQLIILDTPLIIDGGIGGTNWVNGNNVTRVFLIGSGIPGDILSRSLTLLNMGVANGNGAGNVGGAPTPDGGCIYVATNSAIILDASVIRGCIANGGLGGGIYGTSGSPATIGTQITVTNNSTILDNIADSGGGLYMTTGRVIVDQGACIRQNTAVSGGGGGMFINKDCHTTIGSPGLGYIIGNTAPGFVGGGGVFLAANNSFVGNGARFYGNTLTQSFNPVLDFGSAWHSGGNNQGNHPNAVTPRSCVNCCIVGNISGTTTPNNGHYAVFQNVNVLDSTWTNNWWGSNWGPWIYQLDTTQLITTIGSSVSNGDGIRGNGILAINVGLTDDGTYNTRPTGGWLTSTSAPINGFPSAPPNNAPADCQAVYCSGVSSIGQNRVCQALPSCGLGWATAALP